MAKRGRPKKECPLDEYLEVRLSTQEKRAFRHSAELAGIPMATWVRERLRKVAISELGKAELPVRFLR